MSKIKPGFKLWLEGKNGFIFGQGAFELLSKVEEFGSLSAAAQAMDMSYRYAWGLLKKVEKRIGKPILETHKGGKLGGGWAKLTSSGHLLLKEYQKINEIFMKAYSDELYWESLFMKISARNRLEGEVLSVEKDNVAATVKIKITAPAMITALITRDAVEDLEIEKGDKIKAVIKATEVMISKEID